MKSLFALRDLPEAMRRRIELAVAMSQERLLVTHVRHALALVRLTEDRLPYGQAVSIYTRVLGLTEDEARVITTRAFAQLGQKAAEEDWADLAPETEPEERTERRRHTLLDLLKNRLRGRVDDEMRRRVELAAARAEVALLETHIENAFEFLDLLQEEMPAPEAVELYLDALDVREGIAEVVYYKALAHLAESSLPPVEPERPVEPVAEEERPDEIRLRVIEREGGSR